LLVRFRSRQAAQGPASRHGRAAALTVAACVGLGSVAGAAPQTQPAQAFAPTAAASASAEAEPEGRAIMEAVRAEVRGVKSEVAEVRMILTDRSGEQVAREGLLAYLAGKDGDRFLVRFTAPEDIRGTAFLTRERPGEDDRWLHLPALDRTKRIASRTRSGSFAGTQFAYEDLGGMDLDAFRFTRLRADSVDGAKADVVEGIPLQTWSGYSRILWWVTRDPALVRKAEYYDPQGALLKTSRTFDYTKPDGRRWRFGKARVENAQTGRGTAIEVRRWTIDPPLDESRFTVEGLGEEW
jgi:hypothetical protein